ncbi:MAG: ArsB/NhaD family transporter [Polyangiaceae bacterium]
MSSPLVALAIFAATLVLAMVRPRGIHEAVWTVLGATAMLATGAVRTADLAAVYDASHSALFFLVALLIVSAIVDRSGLFEWGALHAARSARGRGQVLFRNVVVLGTVVTATLSLDTTAVLLTPVVLAFVRRLDVPARPYVIACAFIANAASLPLPVSNLTNLILTGAFHIPFCTFTLYMVPAGAAAVTVTYLLLRHHFRNDLPDFDASLVRSNPMRAVPHRRFFQVTIAMLLATLVGYFVAPWFGIEPYVVAFAAAGILAVAGVRAGRVDRSIMTEISWDVVPFVVGLFVVVQGVARLGVVDVIAAFLGRAPGGVTGRVLLTAGVSGAAANVVNNLPAALVARTVLAHGAGGRAMIYATLIGTNVGPNLLPFGSLASVLVLSLAKRRGVRVSTWEFVQAGIVATPLSCVAAALVIVWLVR